MNRRERLTRWVATRLPLPLAEAPERVLINVMCVLIGIVILGSSSHSQLWPQGIENAWALLMIGGGAAAILGYWNTARHRWASSLERTGYLAILLASASYGTRVMWVFGWRGAAAGGLFFAIAVAKTIRLTVSTASRDHLLQIGRSRGDRS